MIPNVPDTTTQENAPSVTGSDTEALAEVQQDSTLLKLPIEVFQTITWHMDAGTFFTSLHTCKFFFSNAKSKPNLFHQINSMPGLKLGLDELTPTELLLQFRRRAAESGCAAGVLADVALYAPASRIPLSNAVFSHATPSQRGTVAQVATIHEGGVIQIYDLGRYNVRHKTELHIQRPEDENDSPIDILKMAFSPESRDLAALYRYHNEKIGSSKSFYRLVTFHRLSAKTKRYFYSSSQQETRDLDYHIEAPVGLALASDGNACIVWKHPACQLYTKILLIRRDEKLMEACSYGEFE